MAMAQAGRLLGAAGAGAMNQGWLAEGRFPLCGKAHMVYLSLAAAGDATPRVFIWRENDIIR